MFVRVHLPSPLTPNSYFSPQLSSPSFSSKICSDQNPSCADRSFGLFSCSKSTVPFSLSLSRRRSCCGLLQSRCTLGSCRVASGNESAGSDVTDDDDNEQYTQALLLLPETIRHYNLWKQGFIKENKLYSGAKKYLFYSHRREVDFNVNSIGHGFLRRFQSPTIFLKLACDGGLLLPIIVGEFAIIRLIDSIAGEEHEECPDLLQFVKNIVIKFGYEAADNSNISIDARPSDALNVAERFKAPIYVNKEIVVKDAIKVVYGNWRPRSTRMVYDVSLDSAPEEPDPLIEELDLVLKLNKAVQEEKFEDAVLWRDKLSKLRMSKQE